MSKSQTPSWDSVSKHSSILSSFYSGVLYFKFKDNDFQEQVFPGSQWLAGGVNALGIAWGH